MTWLNLTPEAESIETIDCRDPFNGNSDRERIERVRPRNTDLMPGAAGEKHHDAL